MEALWVRRLRQDRGCQQLVPVLGDDGEGHHQDAQGQVRDHFGQSLAQERRQGESLYHFAVQVITHRACAGLPVKDREGVDRLRAGLRKEAPVAGRAGVGLQGKGVHRDAPPNRVSDGEHGVPQRVPDGRTEDGVYVLALAEVLQDREAQSTPSAPSWRLGTCQSTKSTSSPAARRKR